MTPLAVAVLVVVQAGDPAGAVTRPGDTVLAAAYADPGVRALLERARAYRGREADGLESYEATFRERIYVGLSAFRFRRERVLFHRERAARIRWTEEGEHAVRWLGLRQRVPILDPGGQPGEGGDPAAGGEAGEAAPGTRDAGEGEGAGEAGDGLDAGMIFHPADDRLTLSADFALHPLADTAPRHYRYRSGDTLRIHLPGREAPLTVVEAVVEPRAPRFSLISGSLWLEEETGALVRVVYRPSRAFDLAEEDPDAADDVPGVLRPVRVEIEFITLDYALYGMRWWLPRRIAFRGRLRLGRVVRVPGTLEWTYEDYRVNPDTGSVDPGPALPEGWSRRTVSRTRDSAAPSRVTVVTPPRDSLEASAELPEPAFSGEPLGFTPEEVEELRRELDALVPAEDAAGPGETRLVGPRELLRYNRVSGPTAGAGVEGPVGPFTAALTARLGLADLEPDVVGELRRESGGRLLAFRAYRRLSAADDWGIPLGFGNSAQTLLFGEDDGHYFRATGAELAGREDSGALRTAWRLFGERHEPAPKATDFSLSTLGGATLRPNIDAAGGSVAGVSGRLRFQTGFRPDRPLLSGSARAEAAAGDFDYVRVAGSLAFSAPLPPGLAGAVEAGAGTTGGGVPPQRLYYLGGTHTLRGFEGGTFRGDAFWFARAEVASRFPGARVVVFGDAGWAGSRGAFAAGGPGVSAGVGASFLDGIVRVDVARALEGARRWRLHLYVDGLF